MQDLYEELAALHRAGSDRLEARLDERLATHPRCPAARYLRGCACFDRGRVATGVRHFMVAHHADAALQSAALLVFAGLNLTARRGAALLPVLLDTWEEFRRPQFDRFARERRLLDALAEPPPSEGLPPMARRLWRLPLRTLRAQIRQAVLSGDVAMFPMLSATT
ncbi:MAG: hypothetical protein HRU75_14305 [Planctomycetia bacterium]|nr:MAG: hypothetical protein HRU75_14305 [Planctomycetia bacterium]